MNPGCDDPRSRRIRLNAGGSEQHFERAKTSVLTLCFIKDRREQIRMKEHLSSRFGAGDIQTLDQQHVAAPAQVGNEQYERVRLMGGLVPVALIPGNFAGKRPGVHNGRTLHVLPGHDSEIRD